MENSRPLMPRLTTLGGWEMDACYKQVAPDGAFNAPLAARLFNKTRWALSTSKASPTTEE
jgi:hypothetical protein